MASDGGVRDMVCGFRRFVFGVEEHAGRVKARRARRASGAISAAGTTCPGTGPIAERVNRKPPREDAGDRSDLAERFVGIGLLPRQLTEPGPALPVL